MLSPASRSRSAVNIWPGFVDALASVLMVFIFMLLIFVIAQFFLSHIASSRFGAIEQLSSNINALLDELSIEQDKRAAMSEEIAALSSELGRTRDSRDRLAEELSGAQMEIEHGREALTARQRELASLEQDIEALRTVRDGLEARIAQLTDTGERREQDLAALRDRSKSLEARLADERERTRLAQVEIEQRDTRIETLQARGDEQARQLGEERALGVDARAQIVLLNEQLGDLRARITRLSAALDVSEQQSERDKVRIEELGQKLNLALAEQVEKLSRYRSEFFGRLREALGERSDIRISGDRFVFQSEVLFPSGSDQLEPSGREQLDRLAETLKDVAQRIPSDVDWILRVDGHTDRRPISTAEFRSNWELSTARALSIVRHLIDRGIAPKRLGATGFGEFRPIDAGDSAAAFARNRRIELKLTEP
jgi:chemotaxis protein MotB